jgi:twitching motility protein PilU
VLAGDRRQDVASAVLSVNAVEALADQILSSAGRQELSERGEVAETVTTPAFPRPLTAKAERSGNGLCIELIVRLESEEASDEPEAHAEEPAHEVGAEAVAGRETPPAEAAPSAPEPAATVAEPDAEPDEAPPVAASAPEASVGTRVDEPAPEARPHAQAPGNLLSWLRYAAGRGATTLYLRPGTPPAARIDERIQPLGSEPLDEVVIEEATTAFGRGGDGTWQARPDGEWVRDDEQIGYISCRTFSDHRGSGLVAQLRPSTSPKLLHRHIPRQIRTACEGDGLVVVTARTEADAEALSAAVADLCGRARGGYLVSLKRRGRVHDDVTAGFVSHRTVSGSDADFAAAIRRATQEGPDTLLVTGAQSDQPLEAATLAAASGRLVIVGIVADSTIQAIQIAAGSESHLRRAMAAAFRAAVGYQGLRRVGGGRALVHDVIVASSDVCRLIEAGDAEGLGRAQLEGMPGTRSSDEALARAVVRRQVSLREAAAHAVDRRHMVTLVRRHARARWAAARAKQDEAARVGDDHEGDHVTAAASMLADGYSAA